MGFGGPLTPRQCNVSLPRRRQRPRCAPLAYPLADLVFFLRNWDNVVGFIGFSTAYFIHFVSVLQCSLGVSGAIGEIGVAGGKSFAVLAFTRRANEHIVACDLFRTGYEKDNVPDANLPLFLDTLEQLRIPEADVVVLRQSSLQLRDRDLVGLAAGRRRARGRVGGFRMFHVDGGHYAEAALHDINSAACALVPGGIVLVDDLHNMGWPGVQEGFHRYMTTETRVRPLVPFLYTGRLFLTTPGYASAYRRAILRAFPNLRTNTLYETEVVAAPAHLVDVTVDSFVTLLQDDIPRT
eukprot:CAMPEP_0204517586 /NCGR_PEP_ID=MMETSP0661-20131031/3748_1 /ASSEMBLY_ACC=CAM_ASM_000606 /TAXON_ID=109239 /ORGANISM="Alexandrium margalefi, Strain AMGDE01CS-322" /LENGTH=294 /DNA_ID=CAMNT_0051522991 /DNA_START=71 /DNA_END=955 /DNA_ORIENTATION=-